MGKLLVTALFRVCGLVVTVLLQSVRVTIKVCGLRDIDDKINSGCLDGVRVRGIFRVRQWISSHGGVRGLWMEWGGGQGLCKVCGLIDRRVDIEGLWINRSPR